MSKFVLRTVSTGYKFDLKAANGQVILSSEIYATRAAAVKGIASVQLCAAAANLENQTEAGFQKALNPKFEMYQDKAGQFRFRLKARNGKIIGTSEGYTAKAGCLNGVESVRANAPYAQTQE